MHLSSEEILVLKQAVVHALQKSDYPEALSFVELLYQACPNDIPIIKQYIQVLRFVSPSSALQLLAQRIETIDAQFYHQAPVIELFTLLFQYCIDDEETALYSRFANLLLRDKIKNAHSDRHVFAMQVIENLVKTRAYDLATDLIGEIQQHLSTEMLALVRKQDLTDQNQLDQNQLDQSRIQKELSLLQRELGLIYEAKGEMRLALKAYSRACVYDDPKSMQRVSALLGKRVPTWHFPMMNDRPRNEAFEQALINRIQENDIVLDIGCGSGLLSMMAVRAGAQSAIAIESEEQVIKVAAQVIETNGYGDEITLIHKRSTQLSAPEQLPLCDLLVCEIFDVSLLGEDALFTIAHAKKKLLKPNAKILPQRLNLWVQVVESDDLRARYRVDEAQGFDLSAFNQLRDPRLLQLDLKRFQYQTLSAPYLAFSIDLESDFPLSDEDLMILEIESAGRVDGLIFWYDLILDEANDVVLSTSPHQENTHWLQGFAPRYCDHTQCVNQGELLNVTYVYHRFLLNFDFE
jgi:2-polyprenyl-3-methyl-5-hydroxy-6-metoxy-1,4-benzoquinol methylase